MKLLRPAAAIAFLVLVIAGGAFAWTRFNDDEAGDSRPLVTAPVERRTLRQSIVTRGTVAYPVAQTLSAPAPGRVTAVHVATGTEVAAGTELLAIDGRPMVAIAGALPFWRDLTSGDEGADVFQLEAALAAEGFDPGEVDDTFTFATELALIEWQELHGFPTDGEFRIGDAAPGDWPARTGAVHAVAGQFVSPGQPLIAFTAPALEVVAQLAPTQRVRVSEGLAVIVEVTGNRNTVRGTLGVPREAPPAPAAPGQPPAEQTTYIASVLLAGPIEAIDGAQVQATILLAEVPNALVVPLAAIIMDGQGSPAVQVRDDAGAVRIAPVTTGLSEGAFIEVKSGLQGGETVLLEQR